MQILPLRLFLFSLFLSSVTLTAQDLIYDAPLRGPLLVTGTFGELRSDHFHAGLDFRGKTGTPVYAVADGFVSRVVVSPGGFGQAVYVDHPDGHRSVYGHLENFREDLRDTIRARQFAAEAFRQDLRFDSTAFPVRRGDLLGGVGNRGHSFGPHLHFEMREIAGDAPLNPLAFGFAVTDTRAPQIRKIRVYGLDAAGLETEVQTLTPQPLKGGGYTLPDTVIVRQPRIGLALKTYDRQNGMPNWNGIYGGELLADTTPVFAFAFDRIPFEETEYLNALTDYAEWTENTSWYHRFWALTPDAMFWDKGAKRSGYDGTLRLAPRVPLPVRLRVRDYAGNVSELTFQLLYRPPAQPTKQAWAHQYFLPAGEPSVIDNGDLRLELNEHSLYRDCYLQYARAADGSANYLSETHRLHHRATPLHGRAQLALRPYRPLPKPLQRRVILGRCDDDGHWSGRTATADEDGRYRATISSFGSYALYLDTLPPAVQINSFPTDQRRSAGFSILVADNVSAGGLSFRGSIDGAWVLLEYDAKSDKLTYNYADGDPGPGEHRFRIEVSDDRGNATTWERSFRR